MGLELQTPNSGDPESPLERVQERLPSSEANSGMAAGWEQMKDAFFGQIKFEPKLGAGLGGELGPIKGKAEVNIVKGEFMLSEEGTTIKIKALQFQLSGQAGPAAGAVKGQLSTLEVEANGPKYSGPDVKLEGQLGELKGDSAFNLSANTSIGPINIKAGVNLETLTIGAGKFIQGGVDYIREQAQRKIDEITNLKTN